MTVTVNCEAIRKARLSKNLTQQDMADALDVTVGFYWSVEHNEKNPSLGNAIKMSRILGLPVDAMFTVADDAA